MNKRVLGMAVFALALSAAPAWSAILKGPYLQRPAKTEVTIGIETDAPDDVTVEYGIDDSYGLSRTESYFDVMDFPDGARYVYKVRLTGLLPETSYHYRAVHGAMTTPDRAFLTAPSNMTSYHFVAMGDSRNGSLTEPNVEHEAVTAAILEEMPWFYINTGDFVHSGEVYEDWDYHFFVEHELMSVAPFFPIFGNHEDGYDPVTHLSGDGLWDWYFDTREDDVEKTWYSFDYGNVHFVMIDVVKFWTLLPGTSQMRWLRDDLEAYHQNPYTNFLVAAFHFPAFTFKDGRTPEIASRIMVEPVLRGYGVDVVISGHDHFYARKELNGIMHMVTGGGGAPLYDLYQDVENWPGYQAAVKDNHYVLVDVSTTEMVFTAISTTSGDILDVFTITADASPLPDDQEPPDDDDTTDDDATDDDTSDDDAAPADDDATDDAADQGDEDNSTGGCGC